MPKVKDERRILTKEEIILMLPKGEDIHTFRQSGNMLIGADWDREDILKMADKYKFELAGETATSMGHGMAFCDEFGWLFVQTK